MVLLAERLTVLEAALRYVEQKKGATLNDVLVFKRGRDYQQGNVGRFGVHRAVHRNIISTVKSTRCTNITNLFYFWNGTLHVSDGLSVHHQQFKTVYTSVKQILLFACYLFDKCVLLYVQS